jgi:hypothetical protein
MASAMKPSDQQTKLINRFSLICLSASSDDKASIEHFLPGHTIRRDEPWMLSLCSISGPSFSRRWTTCGNAVVAAL